MYTTRKGVPFSGGLAVYNCIIWFSYGYHSVTCIAPVILIEEE